MSTWTMFSRRAMLTALLTPEVFIPLGDLQVALTRSVPVANASPEQLLEPTAGGYGRADYYADAGHWLLNDFGQLYNRLPIPFPVITGSWGLICGWALVSASLDKCITVGELLPFVVEPGMDLIVEPGTLLLGNRD